MPDKAQTKACLCRANMAGEASELLGELANSERLMLVALLHEAGELHVNEMVELLGANRASISRHLGRLREQSIVTAQRKSNRVYYRLNHDKTIEMLKTLGLTVAG